MGEIELNQEQNDGVDAGLTAKAVCICGGAGTGKTTLVRVLVNELEAAGQRYILLAPTGKAALRLSAATQRQAMTIHRLLYARDTDAILARIQVALIDESSMVDLELAGQLAVKLNRFGIRVVLIGDPNQLPPVGPGRPFEDIITSRSVPTIELKTIYRQKGDSWVLDNAQKVLRGEMVDLNDTHDFTFIDTDNIASAAVDWLNQRWSQNMNPSTFQVLTGQRVENSKYDSGATTERINNLVQEVTRPDSSGVFALEWGAKFRVGDRVIQTQNNYKSGVVNGQQGIVVAANSDGLRVEFDTAAEGDERQVWYSDVGGETTPDPRELDLAFAITVHKCVAPDTLVETPRGLQRIDQLEREGVIGTYAGVAAYRNLVRNPVQRMLRIRTKHGYEIEVTPDHGMMAWDGAGYVRVEAQDLKLTQFLRLKLGSVVETAYTPALPAPPEADVRAKTWALPMFLTKDVAEFFGLMVADGCITERGTLRLVKRHSNVVLRWCVLMESIFGCTPQYNDDRTTRRGDSVMGEASSTYIAAWLRAVGGMDRNQKAVPPCVLAAEPGVQAAFLRGLFEDGSVSARDKSVELTTNYFDVAKHVQIMLLRQGIVSVRAKYRGQWRITIYGDEFVTLFRDKIGFITPQKHARLFDELATHSKYRVPVDRELMRRNVHDGESLLAWARQNARQKGYVNRQAAVALGYGHALEFHHDTIVSIEETFNESWCVTVPTVGRFLQNGFDGSNSQGSQWNDIFYACDPKHTRMLQRRLFYTAITRTEKHLTIAGSAAAIQRAIKNNQPSDRNTLLAEKLQGKFDFYGTREMAR